MKKINKLIVTNKSALQQKYKQNAPKVIDLLKLLVAHDKKSKNESLLIFVDDAVALKRLKVSGVVTKVSDQRTNKAVIDKLYNLLMPDYLMIFGAPDIVPQIDLNNPVYHPNDDADRFVESDLPYACDEPFSKDINNFLCPTRVVGRLADINGVNDLNHVKTIIQSIINLKSQPAAVYKNYFAVSAQVWSTSTQKSVRSIFDDPKKLHYAPTEGPNWTVSQLSGLSHFVNCHGVRKNTHFFGQKGDNYPIAVSAKELAGKIKPGTIAAMECCYGAQMFDPGTTGDTKPICNTYFDNGAVAYLGSSTIAYGPAEDNDQADLLTQYFLGNIIWNGASSGRAFLEARHKYILNHGPDLSPIDLKTIGQFSLLGDPSVHPVSMSQAKDITGNEEFLKQFYAKNGIAERRKYLMSKGNSLKLFTNKVVHKKDHKIGKALQSDISNILQKLEVSSRKSSTFSVVQNAFNKKAFRNVESSDTRFHVYSELKQDHEFSHTVTTIKELGGKVVNVKHYVRK